MGNAIIITARMDSERLPGKALVEIAGVPNLTRIVRRFRNCQQVDQISVATSDDPNDHPIFKWCLENKIPCSRGSKTDVMGRVYLAAREYGADYVLRATTDCPFVSWELVDMAFSIVRIHQADSGRVWGMPDRSLPVYGACEFPYSIRTLEKMNAESSGVEREHPGMHLDVNRFNYHVVYPVPPPIYNQTFNAPYRLELDTLADLRLANEIVKQLGNEPPLHRVVRFLDANPELQQINSHVSEKTGPITSYSPEIRARWKMDQARRDGTVEWTGDWSWLTSGSPDKLPKDATPLYCGLGKDYLGYITRGNDKKHRVHLLDKSIITGRATLACSCGANREWYADA